MKFKIFKQTFLKPPHKKTNFKMIFNFFIGQNNFTFTQLYILLMKKYFYVYYSYEEFGRGYIGSRICKCLPEEDIKYFGSYKDKTFNPTEKIILEKII